MATLIRVILAVSFVHLHIRVMGVDFHVSSRAADNSVSTRTGQSQFPISQLQLLAAEEEKERPGGCGIGSIGSAIPSIGAAWLPSFTRQTFDIEVRQFLKLANNTTKSYKLSGIILEHFGSMLVSVFRIWVSYLGRVYISFPCFPTACDKVQHSKVHVNPTMKKCERTSSRDRQTSAGSSFFQLIFELPSFLSHSRMWMVDFAFWDHFSRSRPRLDSVKRSTILVALFVAESRLP